jgi:hypothetical protein
VIQVIAGGESPKGLEDRKWDARDSFSQVVQVTNLVLSFSYADLQKEQVRDNEPLVVAVKLGGDEVHRIFIDQGSSTNIMF